MRVENKENTQKLQNLPIGIQDFEKLRSGNYLYIDKSAIMYELVSTGCYFFLRIVLCG